MVRVFRAGKAVFSVPRSGTESWKFLGSFEQSNFCWRLPLGGLFVCCDALDSANELLDFYWPIWVDFGVISMKE